jgi:Protein of unknown function (DUF1360)
VSLATVVLIGLATFRAARIVSRDTITEPLRESLTAWAWDTEPTPPAPRAPWRTWIVELCTCSLCISVWIAAAFYCAWRWGGVVAHGFIAVLAIAGLQAVAVLAVRDFEAE